MSKQARQPVLFIGHGSPMNAIEENDYTRSLATLAKRLPRPRAILCVSAHWMTEGTWVTHMREPRTIHDFYGFPKELSDVRYPAPGAPEIAELVRATVREPQINLDDEQWGLDHGSWAVLKHMYPSADIPVLQLSVYMQQPGAYHYQIGQALKPLRDEGILIVGSGNIVHNLRKISWENDAAPFDWAAEFDEWVRARLEARDFAALCEDPTTTRAGKFSVPTPDHYYPLLYVLGAADADDKLHFEYEGIQNASISMRCLSFA